MDSTNLRSMSRFLRPGFLVPVGEQLWAVDEFQPVAAVLDPRSRAVERLVSWPRLPAPPVSNSPWWDGWRIFGAPDGLWAQPFAGSPVAWIDTRGLVQASYSAGRRLCGATAAGAWCGPEPRNRHALVQRPAEPEDVLCIQRNGTTRAVTVDRPIGRLSTADDEVYACVRADPTEQPDDLPPTGKPDTGEVWLRLPGEQPIPERLTRAEHGDASPPPRSEPLLPGNHAPGSPWHSAPPTSGRSAALAAGLRWKVGWDPAFRIDPPILATGHDSTSGTELHRVPLQHGRVRALAGWGDFLWIAVEHKRRDVSERTGPVSLLRLDGRDGAVTTPLPAESVEITDRCWSLPRQPPEASSYAEYQRRTLDQALPGARPDHAPSRSADRLRTGRAELIGSWPNTTIALRCTHADYPRLELVRLLPLFDELGRQHPPEHADVHLQEDFDTGNIPPRSQARRGRLFI